MSTSRRSASLRPTIAVILSLVGLVGCASAPDQPATEGEHHTIDITVEDGKVVDDPGPVAVSAGDHVELRVSSDVPDEVHVHGYDILQAVEPGEPATVTFVADIPGQFDAELEEHHHTILELEVR